jgi:hypothetical protein
VDGFEQTDLWAAFDAGANDEQRAKVRHLLRHAGSLLDRIIETFPTYTLHNHVHAENVLNLMGELLGPSLPQLSGLEAAMLLLAAYWHDIGMVFSGDDLANIRTEDAFGIFLSEHPEAFVKVGETRGSDLPLDIAEWYCRWRHADRVYLYLDRLEPGDLDWGVVGLRDSLGAMCRSHNYAGSEVQRLTTNLAGQCDLRFCAIILRLADILDFDRSRSPDAVYAHLGLERRESPRAAVSDVEWLKHLASDGFVFPDDRGAPYTLDFVAGPQSPAVEYDLRQFLDVIEAEFRECAALMSGCSPRWRDLVLPDRVRRENILSKGYKYGEHRFTLDRSEVLQLFMGENLYATPWAFVRELLQNSIDATRHRHFFEQSIGNLDFQPPPIRIDDWTDRDGYNWVRIQDHGMGMSEDIVRDYFLKVGRSYYNSATFKADQLRYAERRRQFTPISRFGIGILSCFVVGDRVEVTTRRASAAGASADPMRLSLTGLEGFYTLQLEPMQAPPMPTPHGTEPGYRQSAGTTIAVRIDPRRKIDLVDLAQVLDSNVLCPPVPIEYQGELIGGNDELIVDREWTEPTEIELDSETVAAVERVLLVRLPSGLKLRVVPLNLTAASPDERLAGQFVVAFIAGGQPLASAFKSEGLGSYTSLHGRNLRIEISKDQQLVLTCRRRFDITRAQSVLNDIREGRPVYGMPSSDFDVQELEELIAERRALPEDSCEIEIPSPPLFSALPRASKLTRHSSYSLEPKVIWSHNGVELPAMTTDHFGYGLTFVDTIEGTRADVIGCLSLSDGLRPDVPVSRNEVTGLSWATLSAINLAIRRSRAALGDEDLIQLGELYLASKSGAVLEDVCRDPLMAESNGWCDEAILETASGKYLSAREIKRIAAEEPLELRLPMPSWGMSRSLPVDFLAICRSALMQLNMQLALVAPGDDDEGADENAVWKCVVRSPEASPLGSTIECFPPLFFIPYEGSGVLQDQRAGGRVNLSHPFVTWLLSEGAHLSADHPATFDLIRSTLLGSPMAEPVVEPASVIAGAIDRLRDLQSPLTPHVSVTAEDFR